MSKKYWKALSGILLALGMVALVLLTTRAAGEEGTEWPTDTFADFCQGTMDDVDVWSEPGTARLDRRWWPNVRVNDVVTEGKNYPRLSFVLTDTGSTTETHFLAVWEDEHRHDHHPDVYFARSTNGGRTWSADVLVENGFGFSPVADQYSPDITVRLADGSLWVVWHNDRDSSNTDRNAGDIYCAISYDQGNSWPLTATVHAGAARLPRIAPHGQSGYLYTVWEDERDDDGDIYISRHNGLTWSPSVKVSDCITNVEQREPNLAVDVDGNVYVVWEDLRENDDGEIYFSRWISGTWGAGTWSANSRLSDSTMDWANDPDIATGPGGALFAAWYERVPTGSTTYDFQIVAARSTNGGDTWSRSVVHRLYKAAASSTSYKNPAIGVDPLGRVYVAWVKCPSLHHAEANVLFSLSPDGGEHWTEPRTLSYPPSTVDCTADTDLVVALDSKVVVAWQDYRTTSAPQIYATGHPADNYLASGEYRRDRDAGSLAAWGNITWTATLTPNTNLALATRVMTTADAGWTEWFTHTTSGETIPHPSGRLIQYRAVFTSTGNDTPILDNVTISYEQYRIYLPLVLKEA